MDYDVLDKPKVIKKTKASLKVVEELSNLYVIIAIRNTITYYLMVDFRLLSREESFKMESEGVWSLNKSLGLVFTKEDADNLLKFIIKNRKSKDVEHGKEIL